MNEKLDRLYQQQWAVTSTMLEEYGPFEVAGVMIAQALRLYKTTLSDSDFNKMMDSISSSRESVQPLDGPIIK